MSNDETRQSTEQGASQKCRYMDAAYPTLEAGDSCSEHRHDDATFALARAFAVACHSPTPSDEQIGWMLDDAAAVVDDFPPGLTEWTVTEPQVTTESGLDFTLSVNGKPYVIQQSEWEPSRPLALATWQEWLAEDTEDESERPTPSGLSRPEERD